MAARRVRSLSACIQCIHWGFRVRTSHVFIGLAASNRRGPSSCRLAPPARRHFRRNIRLKRRTGGGCFNKNWRSGIGSSDRNNKATLHFTPPVRTTKSSAKVLSLRVVKLQSASSTLGLPPRAGRRPAKVRGRSLFVYEPRQNSPRAFQPLPIALDVLR